jgi:hypothetical protein
MGPVAFYLKSVPYQKRGDMQDKKQVAVKDPRQLKGEINGQPLTIAEYNRIYGARPQETPAIAKGALNGDRSFRLLR